VAPSRVTAFRMLDIFIYDLFNDAANISHYIASNVRMINE
jgi:hypothetical protein